MRIIDSHVHNVGILANAAQLSNVIERCGIEWVVLVGDLTGGRYPTEAQVRESNDHTLALMKEIPDRILGFCYVNPVFEKGAVDELSRCFDAGMVGLKLWIATLCTDPRAEKVIIKAMELNLPILVHAWKKVRGTLSGESNPNDMATLARRFPEAKFIMAHTGGDWEFSVKAIRDCPNVAVDFAGSVNEAGAYEMIVRELGENRVIFGTDMPLVDFFFNLGRVLQMNVIEVVKEKILATNFESRLPWSLSH